MPIVDEHSEPAKRRAMWWVLVLVLLLMPPMGLFAFSWFRPVNFSLGHNWLWFGMVDGGYSTHLQKYERQGLFIWALSLPGDGEYLIVAHIRIPK